MALLYIYRNLRTGNFSIRYKGLVIGHTARSLAFNVKLKVNPGGREKVILTRQKNVHAFVVAEGVTRETSRSPEGLKEITYNPYEGSSFMCNGKPITKASIVLFYDGRCYLVGR